MSDTTDHTSSGDSPTVRNSSFSESWGKDKDTPKEEGPDLAGGSEQLESAVEEAPDKQNTSPDGATNDLALMVLPESLQRIDIALERTETDFALLHSSLEWQIQTISDSIIQGRASGSKERDDPATALPTVFGITSALTGEGKTSVALHLALQIARNSFRHVCLIDFGLQEDSILKLLGTQVEKGVTDVLEGRDTVLHTFTLSGYGNLSVMPSGPAPDNAARAARSPSVPEILLAAQQMFDIVIVDLPALSTGNTLPIVAHLDRVLLVATSGITSKRLLQDAISRIGQQRVLGVVLNRVKSATPRWLAKRIAAL